MRKWNESCSAVPDSLRSYGPYSSCNSPGQNTGVGRLSLLQGIWPTQESNQGLLHCRRILYQLGYQGSPLVGLSCHNKRAQTGRGLSDRFIFSRFWRLEIWIQGVGRLQGWFFRGLSPWSAGERLLFPASSQGLSFVCRVLISQCKDISLDGGLDYSSFSLNTSLKALLPNIGIFSSAGNEHFYT